MTNQQINSIVVGEDYDPRFIYYNLSAREDELRTLAGGSAQPILNKSSFARLEIEAPPLSEQRAIANILSTLDDKIELNREMNRTLEAAAQAIFRSWFVDFDPVVAKTDGRKPFGLSDEIAALFPNRFIESEMGPIPEGWKVSTIGDSVETVGGSTPSTKEPSFWDDGDIHWATPKDLSGQTHSVLLETRRKITEAGVGKISSGLLPTGTVLMSSRAPVGYLAINEVPLAVNQGFIAMKCNGDLGNHYILQWAAQEMDEIKSRAGGTTFAEISKRAFRPIPIIAPKKQIHDSWHRLADTLHAKVVHNLRESQTLAALRDLLLPKLLSGEIRVAEAERELEEAGV